MQKEIFRKKSLDRLSSPEELTDYIRVANPSIWLILLTVTLLVAGSLVWIIQGELETSLSVVSIPSAEGAEIYIPEDMLAGVNIGDMVCSDEAQTVITDIAPKPAPAWEIMDNYARHLAGISEDDWVYTALLEEPLSEDAAMVNIISETIHPLEFFSEN